MDINEQCDNLAASLKADPKLAGGFDLIGHSQGGLLTRCYVERHNDPPVHNLISWAGPQDGVYGIPDFNIPFLDKLWSEVLEGGWATGLQDFISFASALTVPSGAKSQNSDTMVLCTAYWKDPYNYTLYLEKNQFLADINNERPTKNSSYKANIVSLNTYALVYSTTDTIVVPRQSEVFEFFTNGSSKDIVPLNETVAYQQDWLGACFKLQHITRCTLTSRSLQSL